MPTDSSGGSQKTPPMPPQERPRPGTRAPGAWRRRAGGGSEWNTGTARSDSSRGEKPTRRGAESARLAVHVQPRASRNEVVAQGGVSLRVRVTAPPAGNAANEAVRALLAETLACPRAAITILRGHSARTKLIGVAGLSPAELRLRLAALA
jgi:uncharacterized protein